MWCHEEEPALWELLSWDLPGVRSGIVIARDDDINRGRLRTRPPSRPRESLI